MSGHTSISGYQYINITQRKDGWLDVVGYEDRDTALIKAGLEVGNGGMVLHCALPVRLSPEPVFHPAPKE